jgi:hypothetical protein
MQSLFWYGLSLTVTLIKLTDNGRLCDCLFYTFNLLPLSLLVDFIYL